MSGAIVAASIGAAGAIAGAGIQSNAAGKAASTQASAAQQAAEYQKQAAAQAVQYQQQQYGQTQQNLSPWMQSGQGANTNLQYLLGVGGQGAGQTPYSPNAGAQPQTAYQPAGSQPQLAAATGNTSMLTNPTTGQPAQQAPLAQSGVQQAGGFSYDPTTGQAIPQTAAQTGMVNGSTSLAQPAATGQSIDPTTGQPTAAGAVPDGAPSAGGYGSLLTPYSDFTAPTGLTMQNDPGYQARLQLGTDALQKSAAARGNVLTGGTEKALDTYAQDYASNEYGNVYNRALQGYQTNQGNYYTGQNNTYNRLMGLSSQGQQAATNLSSLGQQAATNEANTTMQGAGAVNQQNNNAAAATASGYAAQGNIWGNAATGIGNNISNLYALQNQPTSATASGYNPVGTLNPAFKSTQYGAEPAYTNWGGLDTGLPK